MTNLILYYKHLAPSVVDAMNFLQIVIGPVVGIVTGVVASWIYAYQSKSFEKKSLKKRFAPIAGKFIRWWEEDKVKGNNRVFSCAIVKYIIDNKFSIEVYTYINYGEGASYGIDFEPGHIQNWTGEIVMDTLRSGTVVWEQINSVNVNNGFKRIIVDKDLNGISLVGETGFGVERFTEREK